MTAVLDALSQVMGEELDEGRQVHLNGIGYFYPTLTATEEISADTPRKNSKVRLKAIQFRSDQRLKQSVGTVKIKQMKRVKHSAKLSEVEIDMRLKEYFTDHQIMQRSDFQGITDGTLHSHDSYPPAPQGRQATEYRHIQPTDICARSRILRKIQRLPACQISWHKAKKQGL